MHIIDRIFEEMGESTKIARETGNPVQTVNDWKVNGNIPHWRRAAVLAAAHRMKANLGPEALAYLASRDAAPPKQQAAA